MTDNFGNDSLSESSSVHSRPDTQDFHLVTGDDFSVTTKMTRGTLTREDRLDSDEAPNFRQKPLEQKKQRLKKLPKQPSDQKDDTTRDASLEGDDRPGLPLVIEESSSSPNLLQIEQKWLDDKSFAAGEGSLGPDDIPNLKHRGEDHPSQQNALIQGMEQVLIVDGSESMKDHVGIRPDIQEKHLLTGDDFSVITKRTLGTLTKEDGLDPDEAPKRPPEALAAKEAALKKLSKQPSDEDDDSISEASLEGDDNPERPSKVIDNPSQQNTLEAEPKWQDEESSASVKGSLEPDDKPNLTARGNQLNRRQDGPKLVSRKGPPQKQHPKSPEDRAHHERKRQEKEKARRRLNEVIKNEYPKNAEDKFDLERRLLEEQLRKQYGRDGLVRMASTYHNIAFVLKRQVKYEEAIKRLEMALAIKTEVHGPKHPETAVTHREIGKVLREQVQYHDAIEHLELALEIQMSTHGLEHQETGETYQAIGKVYHAQNKYKEAMVYFEKSLVIKVRACGPQHPSTGALHHASRSIGGA